VSIDSIEEDLSGLAAAVPYLNNNDPESHQDNDEKKNKKHAGQNNIRKHPVHYMIQKRINDHLLNLLSGSVSVHIVNQFLQKVILPRHIYLKALKVITWN
jgi:hypothetical protein